MPNTLKYTIINIDDPGRATKRQNIRDNVTLEEVTDIPFCDGRYLEHYLFEHPEYYLLEKEWKGWNGEQGIWYSQYACWDWAAKNGPLLTFEDDAIIDETFMSELDKFLEDLPDDWDFFALWNGDEQRGDYRERHYIGSSIVTKAWQGYSSVCNAFSQAGAKKVMDLAYRKGRYTTCDCFLFIEAHAGNLNAYGLHPDYPKFVWHDNKAASLKILKEGK